MGSLLELGLANAVVAGALALVAVVVGLVSRRPALVHALWLLVLVKLVTPSLVPVPVPWWREPPPPVAKRKPVPRPAPVLLVQALEQPQPPMPMPPMTLFTKIEDLAGGMPPFLPAFPPVPPPFVVEPPVVVAAGPPLPPPEPVVETPAEDTRLRDAARLLGVVWLGGAAVWLLVAVLRIARFQRLLRNAKEADAAFQAEAAAIAEQLGLGTCPRLLLLPGAVPPLLWAVGGRARLFFPESLLGRLDQSERATLLAHEMAHLARRDHWVRVLELLVACLYWWYPLVWLACRRLQAAEEECCDAWVINRLPGYNAAYAGALVETVDFLAEQPAVTPPVSSCMGRVAHLKRRLTMIVRGTTPHGLSVVGKVLLLGLVLLLPLTPGRAKAIVPEPETPSEIEEPQDPTKPDVTPAAVPVAAALEEPDRYQPDARVIQGGTGGQVWATAVSPDGMTLAVATGGTGDNEGALTLFDLASGEELLTVSEPKPIRCVAYSPDGRWLATGDFASRAKVRDAKTGEVKRYLEGHTGSVNALAFTPDSQRLVTASLDKTLMVWDVASGRRLKTLKGHADWVLAVAACKDGKHVVSGSKDNTARVWDLDTGKEKHVLAGHAAWVEGVAIASDGTTVATASHDTTLKLWDLTTGQHRGDLLGHTDVVNNAVFLDAGRTLASCGNDRTVRVWDLMSKTLTSTLDTGHAERIYALSLSPDAKTLVSGGWDKTVKVWQLPDYEERHSLTPKQYKPENNFPILTLACSPDGQTLAVAGEERMIKLLDAATGHLKHLLEGHEDQIGKVVFSPDGKLLVSAGFDGTLLLWDVAIGKTLRKLQGHKNWVFSVAFSPDGNRLVSGGYDKTVRVWDVASGAQQLLLDKHKGGVRAVAFAPDGKRVASAGTDRAIRVWDLASKETVHTLKGHDDSIRDLAYSPDGTRLASCGDDGTVRIWNIAEEKQIGSQQMMGQAPAFALAYSPQGRHLAVVGASNQGNAVRIFDPANLQERASFYNVFGANTPVTSVAFGPEARTLYAAGLDRTIRSWTGQMAPKQAVVSYLGGGKGTAFAAYSPDGQWLAYGSGKTLRLRDAKYGKLLASLDEAPSAVFGMTLSPDGKSLAAACFDKSVRIWDVNTRKLLTTLGGMKDRVWMVAYSPDGSKIAAACGSLDNADTPGEVKVWEVATKQELFDFKGIDASSMAVAWSPDGKWIAVGLRDGTAKLYDAATGLEARVLKGHEDGTTVRGLCFAPDGRHLATGGSDSTVRVWAVATGEEIAELEAQKAGVNCLDWSRDGKHLAAAAYPPTGAVDPCQVILWAVTVDDGELSFEEKARLTGHKARALACAFSPDGKTLATGGGLAGQAGETIVWDVETATPLVLLHGHQRMVEGVVFTKDGTSLITGGGANDSPGEVRFWSLTGEPGWAAAQDAAITGGAWSADGKTLITAGDDRAVKVWDAATGKLLATIEQAHKGTVLAVSLSPDGKTLATAGSNLVVKLWDVATNKEVAELTRHDVQPTGLAWSADSRLLATASSYPDRDSPDGDVKVFDVTTGKEVMDADWAGKSALSVAFAPDGKSLLTGGVGPNSLRVYDVATGKRVREVRGAGAVATMRFSPDGKTLATAHGSGSTYGQGSMQLWDAATWAEKASMTGHTGTVAMLSFAPDGKTLATAGNDGTVKVWDLPVKKAP